MRAHASVLVESVASPSPMKLTVKAMMMMNAREVEEPWSGVDGCLSIADQQAERGIRAVRQSDKRKRRLRQIAVATRIVTVTMIGPIALGSRCER